MKEPSEMTPNRALKNKNKKGRNKKKYEKANKAKSNHDRFQLKQGILNSLFGKNSAYTLRFSYKNNVYKNIRLKFLKI